MGKLNRITLDGETFAARPGQRLLDAALASGVELPHDCRAGRCGSCLTHVRSGVTLGGETAQPGHVLACQAMVFSDLDIQIEPTPPVGRISGRVLRVLDVARDIVEVTIAPAEPLDIFPGQYCRFRFRGYPSRPFSPTAQLTAIREDGYLRLHIKRVRGGRVTPHLGKTIKAGHHVAIEGPFGHAFLRPSGSERLVLVGSGTGFAPIWAVAAAALREMPTRAIALIGASRTLEAFYMAAPLELAKRYPNVSVRAVVDEITEPWHSVLPGQPTDHLPQLTCGDIVYAAGGPAMVSAVGEAATAVGAAFHADPFEPAAPLQESWIESARRWLMAG
ncbi:MAG: 2Fe-2S iron-sulfur cluster binding domain-containing protein [Hyphomicrobiaceae bacterium]